MAVLDEVGLSPLLVELEITETVFLGDGSRAVSILADFKARGFRLAMDDFGTGYSALGYLRRFPLDIIKIDRSLVTGLEQEDEVAMIARAAISLGKSLHKTVVAEGVENAAQFEFLRHNGCDEFRVTCCRGRCRRRNRRAACRRGRAALLAVRSAWRIGDRAVLPEPQQLLWRALLGDLQDHLGIAVLAAIVQFDLEETLVATTDVLAGDRQAALHNRAEATALRRVAVGEFDLPGRASAGAATRPPWREIRKDVSGPGPASSCCLLSAVKRRPAAMPAARLRLRWSRGRTGASPVAA